jgi:undecaprenyl pyrophosphate phosphatase UppP
MSKFQNIILGFIQMAEGFIPILSLGHTNVAWTLRYLAYTTKKEQYKIIEKRKKESINNEC